jgi:hypothetical protein
MNGTYLKRKICTPQTKKKKMKAAERLDSKDK